MDWFDADVTILSYNVYLQFGRYAFLLHTLVGTWFLGKVWTTHLLRHPAIEMIFWTKTHQFNWVKPATKNTTKTLYYTPKQTLTCVFVRTRALLLCSSCTSLITPKQLSVLRQLVWNFTTSLTLLKKNAGTEPCLSWPTCWWHTFRPNLAPQAATTGSTRWRSLPVTTLSTPGQRTATETRHRQANFVVDHCDVRSLSTLARRKRNMANLSSAKRASLRESWNYPFQPKCWARLGIQVLSAHGIQLPSTPPLF